MNRLEADAEIVAFTKGGRDTRSQQMLRGEETPLDFFYGFSELEKAGFSAAMLSSGGAVPGLAGALAHRAESAIAGLMRVGFRPLSARMRLAALRRAKVIISYTDGFSLSLGLGVPRSKERPILIGGFHGLSEIESTTPNVLKPLVRALIGRALAGLDHVFCFGAADRAYAIRQYGIAPERFSLFTHGIDAGFWRPLPNEPVSDFVAAVGQDPSRNFELLARAPGRYPTVIVTRLDVRVPPGADHVRVIAGDFYGAGTMSDQDLRRLYNQARAVVVPVKDTHQQSGYSVTIQAMCCGRPVIVTRTKGLWWPELMRDGENCLLVPPGDAEALGAAIGRIYNDSGLAVRLGRAARETAVAHFNLDKNREGTLGLAGIGQSLWRQREAAASISAPAARL